MLPTAAGSNPVGRVAAFTEDELHLLGRLAIEDHHARTEDADVALIPEPFADQVDWRESFLPLLPLHERNLLPTGDRDDALVERVQRHGQVVSLRFHRRR